MKKRTLNLIVISIIILSIAANVPTATVAAAASSPASAESNADADSRTYVYELATRLKKLGMFMGIGENPDGTTEFDLDRAPTRAEAVVMLVRSLGKGNEASAYPKTHPFKDVPEWADGYISYAYDNGLTGGVSADLFDPDAPVSAEMYLTFVLRALGYRDAANSKGGDADFSWDSPWALAAWCRILPPDIGLTEFTRADVVKVTCVTLYACRKDNRYALFECLILDSAFTINQFLDAFADNPYRNYLAINKKAGDYIEADDHFKVDQIGFNYTFETHLIADMVEDGGVIKAAVLVGLGNTRMYKNGTTEDATVNTSLWLMEFEHYALECVSCEKIWGLEEYNRPKNTAIPERAAAMWDLFDRGKNDAARAEIRYLIDNRLMVYAPGLTYDEAMKSFSENGTYVQEERIETDFCTIMSGMISGVPHGPFGQLNLIYKPGSPLGDGEVIYLPLPRLNGMDRTPIANDLRLSDDKSKLYYSFHFAEAVVIDGYKVHEGGVYSYTVDLLTGKTELTIGSEVDVDKIYVFPY